jgi:transketolase
VIRNVDGHDVAAVDAAIAAAKKSDRPSLICCKTIIGKGAPTKAGLADTHGAALGEREVAATREAIGWTYRAFEIPESIYEAWDARPRGSADERAWSERFASYADAFPELAAEFERRLAGRLPDTFREASQRLIEAQAAKAATIATRKASQQAIEAFAKELPEMIGGSADLTGSVFTNWSGSVPVTATHAGNYVNYGVREFAMAAIANGLALHGGFIPYVGTFLTFSDYMRNAVRMAALMHAKSIFVFTHDSIGLGEDGPTHQPIEHAATLRLVPQLDVWRPCDTVETAVAWTCALERRGPSALLFTRQNVAFVERDPTTRAAIERGGYVLADFGTGERRAVVIATGSEVPLALGARAALANEGIAVRVVSMPCTERFDAQDAAYRRQVLPHGVARLAVEAGASDGWRKYVGTVDDPHAGVVGLDHFGESAPAGVLFTTFGFTVDHVAQAIRAIVGRQAPR